ncbi:restriction endonuclease subunit S [Corallococcus llansteffanensis]|uniref:Restriction endonuclease n=1 Tax=Corallococcus llansteffanensis TaxID=2316731 RepID=A0A3A8Q1Y5_9BACT|nr:restriction endonuclease subunit S [Corallococcus llansteffanensis]RKH58872.1 restriction endonuclease [Corallococcus llansteffanensis]
MSELPPGWTEAPLEALVDILDSARVPLNASEREKRIEGKPAHTLFPYYGATGQVGEIDDFLFDEPLILLGEDGVPFFDRLRHKAYLVLGKCWVNNHAHVLRAIEAVADRRYLVGYLNVFDYNGFVTGSTRLKLTQAAMRSIPVAVAPLPEQKRIADNLDALLARVDACRERLDRVPSILKRFRQSVLAAATSGELTREWRDERGVDGDWPVIDLESVAADFSYGSAAKSAKVGKVPVLRMGNIQDGVLDWGDLVFTSDAVEIAKYRLSDGDVLFNRTNSPELVGKTAVFRGTRDAIYAGYLIRVRCSDRLLPDYLSYCLGSPAGREYCWQVKSDGVSQSNINSSKLAAFTFGLPSVEEQQEIVRRVEELLALNVTLGAKSRRAGGLVERLTPSVLTKAFRGELVPQDPNDEPASELMANLKTKQFNAAAEPPRRRPKIPGKAPTMSNNDKDAIKAAILKLKNDRFSFDELRAQVSADYESLKAAVFDVLEEPSPVVRQVFDKKAKAMQFVRVGP